MRVLSFILFLLVTAGPAAAQMCSFGISSVSFGAVNLLSGANADTTATLSISCTGMANSTVRICPNIGSGSGGATASARQMLSGANILQYQLYQDAARTTVWGSFFWAFAARPPTINLALGAGGSATQSVTIYGRVFGSQGTVPPGSYSSSFTAAAVIVRYRNGTMNACGMGALGWMTANPTFSATATIASNCLVSANNVNFGSHGILSAPVDATGAVATACTVGTAYTIGLNGGLSNAPPGARLMKKGAESITYGLYKDAARSQIWGDASTPGSTISGTGNGLTGNNTVYGRVPAQNTPSAGLYSDTVVVTVTY